MIGVNGVGKTTSVGKLAGKTEGSGQESHRGSSGYIPRSRRRAADRVGASCRCDLIGGQAGADPAAIVYDAVAAAKARNADVLLCDTAGRLHNKKESDGRTSKDLPCAGEENTRMLIWRHWLFWMVQPDRLHWHRRDSFKEVANVTGIILTKLDGTAKGGIAVAIQSELDIPVKDIGVGESIDDLQKFNAEQFVNALFDVKTEEEES